MTPAEASRHGEITLGEADCFLALDRAADALPLFTEAWQQSPEHSPNWWRAYVGSLTCHHRLGSDPTRSAHRYVSSAIWPPIWAARDGAALWKPSRRPCPPRQWLRPRAGKAENAERGVKSARINPAARSSGSQATLFTSPLVEGD